MIEFASNFVMLFSDAALWLLLGLLFAGLLKVWMPTQWMQTHLSKEGGGSVVKAALLGAPLPLCSCGVIPAALGIRRAGASKGATVSFLISTPETGVDSIAVTYALLGPLMAVVRPIAAILSAITAGLLAGVSAGVIKQESTTGCCSKGHCATDTPSTPSNETMGQRIASGLRFGFVDILNDIASWMLLGLLFAAAIATWVPTETISQWGSGLPAMAMMILIGIPMYVCATASTPIAAGLLLAGISPGTVLVFMLAGPATNISTIAVVRQELGTRALLAYLGSVTGVAVLCGLTLDALLSQSLLPEAMDAHNSSFLPSTLNVIASGLLALLFANTLWQQFKGSFTAER
ncbi:SO_0444 family Cu/Zn efflux transporter [Aestuariirhabdus sp. Z084]|uniref:SO_0444 family Cu/Zn efflux transporter n=1 Tax=Aestuariirhabdus haliotis TaxID=2918751 RepID=UPI00201B3E80|nr:SO_0444 family Cu/Zn efflux transporter [Aestuariirhabdus haliotis]MCL6414117.1 SO_0444 family Cu/Zn efflux transporter [Aestuariirhabdus haliotis]MCL6418049.1 SO_0444 family Cu/Zn efflux transporter [Aestuariirhabdus haliotis]